jgi:hypothetical protein
MRGLAVLLLAVTVAAGCADMGGPAPPPTTTEPPASALHFAAPTTPTDAPDGFGTEPSLLAATDGALYFTSVLGSATARGDGLWRSADNGTSWAYLGKADYPFGGGDSDIDELAGGRLLLTGQWRPAAIPALPAVGSPYVTGGESVSYSTDRGATWVPNPVAGLLPGADRNWLASNLGTTAHLVYNDLATGLMVATTTTSGTLWLPPVIVQGTGSTAGLVGGPNGIAGDAVVDAAGRLFIPYGPGPGGGSVQRVFRSDDGGLTFTGHVVHTADPNRGSGAIFSALALDRDGGLYLAYAETKADVLGSPGGCGRGPGMHVYVSRSTDHGDTWSDPVDATPGAGSAVFPWIVAGAPGHVAVAAYATPDDVLPDRGTGPDDQPCEGNVHPITEWWPTVFVSLDLGSANATFAAARASEAPNHAGPICTGGTGCASGRTLGDFFEMAMDRWGHVALVWADDTGAAQANRVAVQDAGPSLL